jgi:hypothetical protein
MICFKLLVIVVTAEIVVFGIIDRTTLEKASGRLSYFNWVIGLPTLLVCCEMPLFALIFFWMFSPAPYRQAIRAGTQHGLEMSHFARLRNAVVDVLNIVDLGKGILLVMAGGIKDEKMPKADGRGEQDVGVLGR